MLHISRRSLHVTTMPPPLPAVKLFDNDKDLGVGTKLNALEPDYQGPPLTPVITPIYQSCNYKAETCSDFEVMTASGYTYRREDTPNHQEFNVIVRELEGGVGSLAFPSGMSALTSTVLALLKSGDHMVAQSPLYSSMHKVLTRYLPLYNIEVTYIPAGGDVEEYRHATKPNTKLYYGEALCNPLMYVLDLEKFAALGKEMGVITMVDSTLSSPINQVPIKFGIDISAHSTTKYIGGHSDILAGCATFKQMEHYQLVMSWQRFMGSCLSAHDAVTLRRSLRTLHVRIERHNENAMEVAKFLEGHPLVEKVFYPGLASHPQHEIAKRCMKGFSGMLSVVLPNKKSAQKFAEATKLFALAVSLGGAVGLIQHPWTMTHGNDFMSDKERNEAGIAEGLVRISVGIESINDIIEDLKQALDQAAAVQEIV